ncbi:MAG: hypothetical protein ACYC32_13730 [Thiobacillus sp.]
MRVQIRHGARQREILFDKAVESALVSLHSGQCDADRDDEKQENQPHAQNDF